MQFLTSLIGKIVLFLSRHFGGGHGSALPGLVVEKINPHFLHKLLKDLPGGVVVVSGTNGKTTTTKIIVELLRQKGLRVFTNPSGSNFTRGVISAALPLVRYGQLRADIAVLELDEAHAVHFVDQVKPRYSVLLNVLRDQLDRFGEIDKTAELLDYVAERTSGVVILNEDDPRLCRLAGSVKARVAWFGYSGDAGEYYRTDEEIHGGKRSAPAKKSKAITIDGLRDGRATYLLGRHSASVKLRLFGIHNALNCAAALATVRAIEGDDFDFDATVADLANIKPAFGRGEVVRIGGRDVQLILVKNPSGFQISLDSVSPTAVLIAINDDYADGRDVSWLWDVDVVKLADATMVCTTGVRAADMALRLIYGGVKLPLDIDKSVDDNIERSVKHFLAITKGRSVQIFATYTAMLKIRDILKREANNK